jgi:hypothetical protein
MHFVPGHQLTRHMLGHYIVIGGRLKAQYHAACKT